MISQQNNIKSQALSETSRKVVDAFEALNTNDKLAWFYYVYKKMGDSVTPAAPTATDPELTPLLMGNYFELDDDKQLAIMRQIVNREDTEYSRAYGILKENNQLMVWYAWAQGMGDTVIGMPADYKASKPISDLMDQIEGLDFQEQISIFRTIVSDMGYTDIKPIPTQAETGKTASL